MGPMEASKFCSEIQISPYSNGIPRGITSCTRLRVIEAAFVPLSFGLIQKQYQASNIYASSLEPFAFLELKWKRESTMFLKQTGNNISRYEILKHCKHSGTVSRHPRLIGTSIFLRNKAHLLFVTRLERIGTRTALSKVRLMTCWSSPSL